MQQIYGASDVTIRRAVHYLRDHEFIETRERSGMFVAEHPPCMCTIGIVMPYDFQRDRSQYLIALENEVKHLAETQASSNGLKRKFVFFSEIEGPPEDTRIHHLQLFNAVESELVGGLFFPGPPLRFRDTAVLNNPNVPCVGTVYFPMPGMMRLSMSPLSVVKKALQILASRGRRRVALITVHGQGGTDGRSDEFVSLAATYGLESHLWWVLGTAPSTPGWARNCTELLFRNRRRNEVPDAVIIGDDNLVPAATAGIAAANVRVPDEVEVVAHTNFPWPTRSEVQAIRIGLDIRRMLAIAVDLIERKRNGDGTPDLINIEPCLEGEATA